MGLHTIPFHASLLKQPLTKNKKASNAHVLIYGAIEVHANGEKGCIASNDKIAKETGYAKQTVINRISEMAEAEWITVVMKDHKRVKITPNASITFWGNPPLPHTVTPPTVEGNIYNSIDNNPTGSLEEESPGTSFSFGEDTGAITPRSGSGVVYRTTEAKPTIKKLYYDVIRKYKLPNQNNNVTKSYIKKMENDLGYEHAAYYLEALLRYDIVSFIEVGKFVPRFNSSRDIYEKWLSMERALRDAKENNIQIPLGGGYEK